MQNRSWYGFLTLEVFDRRFDFFRLAGLIIQHEEPKSKYFASNLALYQSKWKVTRAMQPEGS